MHPKAILFGSIGTLIETSDLQRRAFNAAFQEAGLDWIWDVPLYKDLLDVPGGKARIEAFAEDRGLIVDSDSLHRRKTEIFNAALATQTLILRPGVLSVISAASAAAVPLGFASTTDRQSVENILRAAGGLISPKIFAFVGDLSQVKAAKPASDIYALALAKMGVAPSKAIAIEDTESSMSAALRLGIPTVAFPGACARGTFAGASAVVKTLSPKVVGLGCEMRGFAIAS